MQPLFLRGKDRERGFYAKSSDCLFIRKGSDIPRFASAWLKCRSLLAGEVNMNRLQAGSYKSANE
jgi:hypothetical protein